MAPTAWAAWAVWAWAAVAAIRTANTTDNRRPKGDHRPPRPPRFPIPPFYPPGDTVVSVPGGPPSSPPPNFGGGGGGGGGGQPPQPTVTSGRYVPNEVLVEVASNVSPQTMAALMRRHRLTQLELINLQFTNTSIRRLRINDRRSAPTVVRALASEGFTVQLNQIAGVATSIGGAGGVGVQPRAIRHGADANGGGT